MGARFVLAKATFREDIRILTRHWFADMSRVDCDQSLSFLTVLLVVLV